MMIVHVVLVQVEVHIVVIFSFFNYLLHLFFRHESARMIINF